MDNLEQELKELIIEAVMLEGVAAADMDSEALLFPTYELDSIDGLELAMVIKRRYGIEFVEGDEQNKIIFKTIRSLADHVRTNRAETPMPAPADKIFQMVRDTIVEQFEISSEDISLESRLFEDLDLDSIDALDMVVKLQEFTGKRIAEGALKQVRTVGQIVTLVEEILNETGAEALA